MSCQSLAESGLSRLSVPKGNIPKSSVLVVSSLKVNEPSPDSGLLLEEEHAETTIDGHSVNIQASTDGGAVLILALGNS